MKLLDFVVCDDIRFETGNKASLMGVYNDSMFLTAQAGVAIKWPVVVRLGVYARLLAEKEKASPNRFLLDISHENNVLTHSEGELEIQDLSRPFALALPLAQLPIPGPGHLTFRLLFQRDSDVVSDIIVDRPFAINRP
jgi:hypothetical protein